ncbi:SCO family protein [Pontibacter sp. CAU 1760]
MSKVKALILGLLLLVPLLIFAFISIFGEHHFSLKTYFPVVDERGGVMYTADGDTVFQQLPDFSLQTSVGQAYTATDLEGEITVIQFFDAGCTKCQKTFSELVRLQEAFEAYPEVKFLSITQEPEQDSLAALQQIATAYGAKADTWRFVTGDRSEILGLAEQGFQIPVGKQRLLVTDQLMLVDREKRVRGVYDALNQKEIERLKTEINVLRDEYAKSERR